MEISAFRVDQLTQQPLSNHMQDHQFHLVVAAVFHHDAVPARFFRRLHKLPALLQGNGRRNFSGGMFSILHRRHAYGRMQLPRRGRVDEIQILLATKSFKIGEASGLGLPGIHDKAGRLFRVLFRHLANRSDHRAGYSTKIFDMNQAHAADSDEPDADWLKMRIVGHDVNP